jgi:hypothetical protein
MAHGLHVRLLRSFQNGPRYKSCNIPTTRHLPTTHCILYHSGQLRVGELVNMFVVTYKRKRVGPKYQGTVLFMKMMQYNVTPKRKANYYECRSVNETSVKYVRVQDLCTLLASVRSNTSRANRINLVPIAQAFPVSWVIA